MEEHMTDKKQKGDADSRKPIKTFRNGAVGGSVWLKQSNTGYWYYDLSLSRSWKSMTSGKEGYSSNFFERNRADLHATIDDCCDYIVRMIDSAETITLGDESDDPSALKAA
jgi:hypothetical protein